MIMMMRLHVKALRVNRMQVMIKLFGKTNIAEILSIRDYRNKQMDIYIDTYFYNINITTRQTKKKKKKLVILF